MGFSYLLLVLIVASTWGFLEVAVSSILATLLFNFFFLPPVDVNHRGPVSTRFEFQSRTTYAFFRKRIGSPGDRKEHSAPIATSCNFIWCSVISGSDVSRWTTNQGWYKTNFSPADISTRAGARYTFFTGRANDSLQRGMEWKLARCLLNAGRPPWCAFARYARRRSVGCLFGWRCSDPFENHSVTEFCRHRDVGNRASLRWSTP